MKRFIIPFETPSKKNNRITLKNGKTIPNLDFLAWHKDASTIITLQNKTQKEELKPPLKIRLTFTHGDLKRRDSDNQASSILDLLQDNHIIEDDNWKIIRNIEIINEYTKDKPNCLIELTTL